MPATTQICPICPICNQACSTYDMTRFTDSPGCDTGEWQYTCWTCGDRMRCWNPTQIECSPACEKIGVSRCFGVEIETSACANYCQLRDKTCFGAKFDGSISGMEFISPILRGDDGIKEVKKFLRYANKQNFQINSDCGLHVHIDARDLSPLQRRKVAYAFAKTQPVWQSFVSQFRAHESSYCHPLNYGADEIRNCHGSFIRFANSQARYNWFNITSLSHHGTFEVRLHHGSVNSQEICNWITAVLRFTEAVKDMKYSELDALFDTSSGVQFYSIKRLWGSKKLSRYYNNVTRLTIDGREENRLRCQAYNHIIRSAT
jgi:hypothetical protein